MICSVDNCQRKYVARGLCLKHYKQAIKGDIPLPARKLRTESAIRIYDSYAEVELSKDCWTKISLTDVERVRGKTVSISATGYAVYNQHPNVIKLHRFLVNAPNGVEVDHINNDSLDNRQENLRIVTHSENMRNSVLTKHPMFGIEKRGGSYRVRFAISNEPKKSFGSYSSLIQAQEVRNKILKETNHNFTGDNYA